MPTPAQIRKILDALYEDFNSNFTALYLPMVELKRLMFKRIFGVGTSGGTNSEGQKLPTKPYSTTPIYVSPRSVNSVTSKFQFGKPPEGESKGKPINSMYFPNGYAQLKKETPAKLPLELTGRLKGGFLSEEVITEGLEAAIALPASESGKVDGLELKYGIIYQPTAFEQEQMLEKTQRTSATRASDFLGKS